MRVGSLGCGPPSRTRRRAVGPRDGQPLAQFLGRGGQGGSGPLEQLARVAVEADDREVQQRERAPGSHERPP